MGDRLRWPRAIAGALFGGVCALVLMALGIVQSVLGDRFDASYGDPIYCSLLLVGPVMGFLIGQRTARRK